jgi:hypothetical protein
MDVTVHNGIEKCPKQCANADIRVWKKLQYGVRKASIVGVETFVTCAHASVCKKLIEQQSEAKS